jgi:hypothetical protein
VSMTLAEPRASRSALRDPSPDSRRRVGDAPERRPGSPLTVVPDGYRSPRRRRIQRRVVAAFAVLAVLGAPFALVLVHVELTANQLRLTSMQNRADAAQQRYEKLRLQVAQLESPARVVATAQRLGMVTPTTIHYLTASSGTAPSTSANAPLPSDGQGVDGWATAKHVDTGR